MANWYKLEGHTPTPWVSGGDYIKTDNILYVLAQTYTGCDTSRYEARANAAFIVRACNNFDQMLEALKDARDRLDYYQDPLAHAIKQVIANAEKE